jgi:hypothetical protein
MVSEGMASTKWQETTFPLFSISRISFFRAYSDHYFSNEGKEINEAACFTLGGYGETLSVHSLYGGGDLVYSYPGVVGLRWKTPSAMLCYDGSIRTGCSSFPDEWSNVAIVAIPARNIYNCMHSILGVCLDMIVDRVESRKSETIQTEIDLATKSAYEAVAFLARHAGGGAGLWTYLRDKHRSQMKEMLWLMGIFTTGQLIICKMYDIFDGDSGMVDLFEVAFGGSGKVMPSHPPPTGTEWRLEEVSRGSKEDSAPVRRR